MLNCCMYFRGFVEIIIKILLLGLVFLGYYYYLKINIEFIDISVYICYMYWFRGL